MIWETLANIPLAQLLGFVAGGLVLNFAPGQDVFFATACGLQGGPRAGALAGLGVGMGVVVHVLLATAGLGAVIAAHPGIKQWLTGALARRMGEGGIVANLEVVLPST